MTDDEIRQAAYDSIVLRWTIEDDVRYGAPLNARMTLSTHPEHLSQGYTRHEWMQMSTPLSSP